MPVLKLNEETLKWEEQPKYTRGCLEINNKHKRMLDRVKKVVMEEDRDWVGIYAGNVGDGKSTKMTQDLKYLDPTFNYKRVCQTEEDFKKKIQTLGKYQSIALDEAFDSLSSAQVSQRGHKIFVNLLQVIRQQNLFIGLSLPNWFDLNKTTAIFRSNLLVIVYSKKGKRTFFKVFNRKRKKALYLKGKKELNDMCVKSNYRGRFNKNMQIDEVKYKIEKKKAFEIREENKRERNVSKTTRDEGIKKLKQEGKSIKEIAKLFNLTETSIRLILKGER